VGSQRQKYVDLDGIGPERMAMVLLKDEFRQGLDMKDTWAIVQIPGR
jgi:hypothetical protein